MRGVAVLQEHGLMHVLALEFGAYYENPRRQYAHTRIHLYVFGGAVGRMQLDAAVSHRQIAQRFRLLSDGVTAQTVAEEYHAQRKIVLRKPIGYLFLLM